MKRVLFASCTIGAICLAPAAQAVDYVQCEAMDKAKEKLLRERSVVTDEGQIKSKQDQIREKCGVTMMGDPCPATVLIDQQRLVDDTEAARAEVQSRLNVVVADMKAAGCPYQ